MTSEVLSSIFLGWTQVFGVYYIGTAWGYLKGFDGAQSFYMSTVVGRIVILRLLHVFFNILEVFFCFFNLQLKQCSGSFTVSISQLFIASSHRCCTFSGFYRKFNICSSFLCLLIILLFSLDVPSHIQSFLCMEYSTHTNCFEMNEVSNKNPTLI